MKYIYLFASIFFSIATQAQETETDIVWMKDYNALLSGFVATGNNMTKEAHNDLGLGIEFKLGIIQYKKFGVAAFVNFSTHDIDNNQMIGDFDKTNFFNYGGAIRYRIDLDAYNMIKPEAGLFYSDVVDTGNSKKAKYDGLGYKLGMDYLLKFSKHASFVVGAHYHITHFNMAANPRYEDYFRKSNRIQVTVGFNFN